MLTPGNGSSPWEEEGRRIGESFDRLSAAVVVGADPIAAAQVALGIARMQARRRRVAVSDLVGELPPLQQLLPRDATYGVLDSFLYGVSLSKIAYPIDPAQNLYIMPSGAGPLDHEALLASDQWRKMASGFREANALLLILAPLGAPGLDQLVAVTDGAIVVGDSDASVPGRVVAEVQLPESALPPPAPPPRAAAAAPQRPVLSIAGSAAASRPDRRRLYLGVGAAGVIVAAVIGGVMWAQSRRSGGGDRAPKPAQPVAVAPAPRPTSPPKRTPSPQAAAQPPEPVTPAPAPEPAPAPPPPPPSPSALVVNPGDSAAAATFGIELVVLNTMTSAISQLEHQESRGVPATSWVPVVADPDRPQQYRLVAGAYRTREVADSLLRRLRAERAIPANAGRVIRAPFALLVERNVARENAPGLVRGFRLKGLPVYALLREGGTADLYAGAFETVEQATQLANIFRASGETPSLAYRAGRVF